jgi:hypothetical protein
MTSVGETPAFLSAITRCNSTAQRSASTTLEKFDEEAVAGGLDDAALVLGDHRVDQLAADRPQPRERTFLVGADQPAVARDIRRENGRQSAFDAFCGQGASRLDAPLLRRRYPHPATRACGHQASR